MTTRTVAGTQCLNFVPEENPVFDLYSFAGGTAEKTVNFILPITAQGYFPTSDKGPDSGASLSVCCSEFDMEKHLTK